MKNITFKTVGTLTTILLLSFTMSGCGGGGGDNSSTPKVSGVAATGAPMSGTVFLKDSANNPEMSTTIVSQGEFAFNVSGKTAPFILRAGSLYSMSGGPGTANINPLSTLMVADMGGFSNMSSMNTFYVNPNGPKLQTMFNNMSTSRLHLQQTMDPLLTKYGVTNPDPIAGQFSIGQGMDRMFDDVKMSIAPNGAVTMMYVNGSTTTPTTPAFTGQMGNMAGMQQGTIVTPPTTPVPSGITITPGVVGMQVNGSRQLTANISVTWSVVSLNGGSITSGGLYTAPAFQGMFIVKATSVADPTKSATATIQVGSMGMNMGMM